MNSEQSLDFGIFIRNVWSILFILEITDSVEKRIKWRYGAFQSFNDKIRTGKVRDYKVVEQPLGRSFSALLAIVIHLCLAFDFDWRCFLDLSNFSLQIVVELILDSFPVNLWFSGVKGNCAITRRNQNTAKWPQKFMLLDVEWRRWVYCNYCANFKTISLITITRMDWNFGPLNIIGLSVQSSSC